MKTDKDNIIKLYCIVDHQIFYKEEFGIVACTIEQIKQGEVLEKSFTLKGQMVKPKIGHRYYVVAEAVEDPKYGKQYNAISMCSATVFESGDEIGQKKFLRALFTENQVAAMYDALEDPFQILLNGDVNSLVKVRGCGIKNAVRWCHVFHSNYYLGQILVQLDKFNLTNKMIEKLLDRYKSPDLVIEKVTQNPYILCSEVDGIGWAKADKIALDGGIPFDSPKRVGAFIRYYLERCGEEGCSWITTDELVGAILDNLGEEISDKTILDSTAELGNVLWWNETRDRVGLQKYKSYEDSVADEILRIRNAENNFQYDSWQDVVKRLEGLQGWSYSKEQLEGIECALKNNFVVIQGYAGTGKSTLVSALIEILSKYSYVQCALSGRASSRMTEITGKEGYTIHRLLGFPKGYKEYGCFVYHKDNQLTHNIYIVDEISMVDIKLFWSLLSAIPSGAKVICLGDTGQLESIGCGNLAYDIIQSGEIPVVSLTKIHRQAEKSAIITESIKIRKGEQIISSGWVGDTLRGELQDLRIECYSDASNTYYRVMKAFTTAMNHPDFDIMETQVLVPVKRRGSACTYELNNSIQELYNPADDKVEQRFVHSLDGKGYYLRVGDKVINTKNNYKTSRVDGELCPIYNGSLGIVKSFEYHEDYDVEVMIIDFLGIGEVVIPSNMWYTVELGYAITVHKFQGSQANHVIFGLDSYSYNLAVRELVYTGITRAKKLCELIAQNSVLRMATAKEQVSKKQTHLKDSLYEKGHPKLVF